MKAAKAKKNLYAQKLAASKAQRRAKKVAAKKAESPEVTFQKLDLAEEVEKLKAKAKAWNGLCPAGHGLDYEGQPCDYCSRLETAALLREKCPHGVAFRIESCDVCDRTVRLTVTEVTSVEEALRGLRQVLDLVRAPLIGLAVFPASSPASEVLTRGTAAEQLLRTALLRSLKQGAGQ